MVTLRNKFNTLQGISETQTSNDEYENFVTAHMEVAAECILTKPRAKCKVPWESIIVRKKQDNMKIASLIKKKQLQMPMPRNLRNSRED